MFINYEDTARLRSYLPLGVEDDVIHRITGPVSECCCRVIPVVCKADVTLDPRHASFDDAMPLLGVNKQR